MSEPKLLSVVLVAMLATGCFALAQALRLPEDSWIRPFLTSCGVVFSCLALALAVVYLAWWAGVVVERLRLAVAAPELARLGVIAHMSDRQLDFAKVDVTGIVEPSDDGEITWSYYTRWGTISGGWLITYLQDEAFKGYPQLSPIRLFSEGSQERTYREAFTRWMVSWGLLEQRPGERFIWLVTREQVLERLGL